MLPHTTIRGLNQKLSIINRVVIHPKYRTIGLGTKIIRETLPIAGTPYVEMVAVMAKYNQFAEKAGYYSVTARVMDRFGAIGEDTNTLIITPNVEIKVNVRKGETAAVVDFVVTNFEDEDVKVIGYSRLNAYDPSKKVAEPGSTFLAFRAETELYTVPARTEVTITAQGLPDSEESKWNPMIHPVYQLYWNAKVDGILVLLLGAMVRYRTSYNIG